VFPASSRPFNYRISALHTPQYSAPQFAAGIGNQSCERHHFRSALKVERSALLSQRSMLHPMTQKPGDNIPSSIPVITSP